MLRIKPTRSELLKTRKRIQLAKKGHELLKKKQDSLVVEFFHLMKDVREQREKVQQTYNRAERVMNEARALESDFRITGAAMAVAEQPHVDVTIRNIAGVRIPVVERAQKQQEYPTFDSMMVQDIAVAYRDVVDAALVLAAKETALRKMLLEIKKTKRRAHALEHILLPRLETAMKHIRFELEEREREEFNRLKRRKKA